MAGNWQDNWNLFSTVSSGLSVAISTVGFSRLPLQWLLRTVLPQIKQPEREADHRRLPLKSVTTSQYKAPEPRQCSSWFAFHRRSVQISAGAQVIVTELIAVLSSLEANSVILVQLGQGCTNPWWLNFVRIIFVYYRQTLIKYPRYRMSLYYICLGYMFRPSSGLHQVSIELVM